MKVYELIEQLKLMPKDADVWHLWDGALRTEIEYVYLSKSGLVGTSDRSEVCYSTKDRPVDAPTSVEERYWHSPSKKYRERYKK